MKEEVVQTVDEDFYGEKPKKKKSVVIKILNVILWLVLLSWVILVLVDYFRARNQEDPMFCWFGNKTTDYENGSVTECMGLGYKVINYNRENYKAVEFGPFWIKDRTA